VNDELLVSSDGAVRVVTINRPEAKNVVNETLHHRLVDVWRELDRDPEARCVVLTGAGSAFSAGGDFAFIKAQHQSEELRYAISLQAGEILNTMINFRLPIVAAVNGPAVGLGASLALSCDLVLMASDSYLCDPHVSIGLTAGDGGALLWPHMISLIKAKEYIYTGERIPAATAVELGLANRMTTSEQLLDDALALAHKLARQPARALQTTKRAFSKHIAQTAVAILDYGLAAEALQLGTAEHVARLRDVIGPDRYDAIGEQAQ
jgi:enoyl-CoA hydratase/carnithine racemase